MPVSAVGGEGGNKPPINVDKKFQKDTKAVREGGVGGGVGGEQPEADRRSGKGLLKVTDWFFSRPVFILEVLEDTVTLRPSVEQMLSHTRTKKI